MENINQTVSTKTETTQTVSNTQTLAKPQNVVAPPSFSLKTSLPVSLPLSISLDTVLDKSGKLADVKVKLSGTWDGHMIKVVVKKIEREYKFQKHNMVRAGVRHSVNERMKTKE